MNLRKTLLHTMLVLLGAVMLSIICTTTSQASIDPTGKLLNMTIPTYRKSDYAYKVGINSKELEMWKIYEYNINKTTIKNQNNAIYCLKMGVGFGSINGSQTQPKTYTKYADMKNPTESDKTEIIQKYIDNKLDGSDQRYNSLIWVLDHCYVPEPSETPTDAEKQAAQEYKKLLLESAEISSNSSLLKDEYKDISNDLIDIVQQIAIWYFTNNENEYHTEEFGNIKLNKLNSNDYKSLEEILDKDWELLNDCKKLYKYFIDGGKANANTSLSTAATNPIKLKSDNAKVTLQQDDNGTQYYIAGPYKLEKQSNTISDYTVSASITGTNTYTLLNSSKQNADINSLKSFAESGEQFYLKINKSDISDNIESIELKIATKVKQNTITYWEVEGNGAGEQPVVEIKPEEKTLEEAVTLKISNFDLALRKFITKINGTDVTQSRVPSVEKNTLTESNTTATKNHIKDPLEVKIGDKVTYTIRIYNEGDTAGYATKVTDYLPEGLTLVPKADSSTNTTYGWTEDEEAGHNAVSTTYLKDHLINAYTSESDIQYQDLEIECQVTVKISQNDTKLKNVAEITEAKDENNEPVVDRDSTPNNLDDDKKNDNYAAPDSTKGWGYEDDDDYEELLIPGKYFDLALRKFITKINGTNVTQSRVPNVEKSTLTASNTTATKNHIKDPLEVKIGDKVTYTIRIYNEGEISGYATKVTDYLPEGLTLVPKADSSINTKYEWTEDEEAGHNAVSTTYLKDHLINAYTSESDIQYQDLEIECQVTVKISQNDTKLKNVAEITEAKDENYQTVVDRDSTPNNLDDDKKNDSYAAPDSTKGWGYEDDDDYEELLIPGKYFDLALRKFIKSINGKELVDNNGEYLREPSVDITPLVNKTDTTANYNHPKNPIGVSVGDIVIYTLRIYNEGELDGYASKVTDYLPPQLQFVVDDDEKFNAKYGWLIDETLRKATTEYLAKPTIDPQDNIIKAFDGENLDYKELQIKCKVVSTDNLDKVITNIAEITEFTDENGDAIVDRDSQKANIVLPNDTDLPNYKGNESNKSVLTDSEYFYKGQQDDDDFEKLILEQFDLALRKFITKVNDTDIINRIPKFTNVKDANGNYIYEHTKEPVSVESTDIVEYTLRIYNEGDIAGYAKEVRDDIPSGLEFLPDNATNQEYRWKMLDENGEETDDITKAVAIVTDYLSKEQESEVGDNLIQAFDSSKTSPDYKDIKVVFKVVALDSYEGIITNIAEISDDSDEEGKEVEDKDSTPKNNDEKEDDIDKEHLKLTYFDLALRKFITGVNDEEITNRVPQFTITEDGKYTYEHTKEPVEVENGDIVTYTLRIYNEGTKDGYAKEVKDDLPEGLEFLPDNDINKEYRWVMIDENGEETEDITEAVSIKTDYLSKEQEDLTERNNLLKKFDKDTMEEPDYRDIKIAFKVTEPNTSDRILINKAQISDDSDENGKDVIDKDSTPDRWVDGEDDQDIEKVKVKYFDLALRKWVTEAIVIDDGKETITQTGHKAEDDPEEVVKVEIKESRLNKVVVKFRYKIRVTNEGEIAGYATEISDYIPEGLRFVQEDNPTWKEVDGKVVTDELKDTLLQPGESAEVEILLTWINGKNNFNLKINTAEISKDKNPSDTPDIDSTPNNKEPEEDDIDDAPVILSIKTGALINLENITLITISLAIIASGVILIKKYVLE